jgi:hypothetical protein
MPPGFFMKAMTNAFKAGSKCCYYTSKVMLAVY